MSVSSTLCINTVSLINKSVYLVGLVLSIAHNALKLISRYFSKLSVLLINTNLNIDLTNSSF